MGRFYKVKDYKGITKVVTCPNCKIVTTWSASLSSDNKDLYLECTQCNAIYKTKRKKIAL